MIFWLVIFVVVYVVLVVVWLIWSEHEETKQDQERRRLDAAMQVTEDMFSAPAGQGAIARKRHKTAYGPQRAAGFNSKRVDR